jgi:hypothetical protein
MSMSPQFRMQECSLCRRRMPRSRCTEGELNGRHAWFCPQCVKAMQTETTAQGVRRASEQGGRKR